MNRALSLEFLRSDLATVESMLAALHPSRILERFSLERRRDELRAELELESAPLVRRAQAALIFGGDPVEGSSAIEAKFAGEGVANFQTLVERIAKQRTKRKEKTRLGITGVVHGSFGFTLEEMGEEQRPLVGSTELAEALDAAVDLLKAAGAGDDSFLEKAAEHGPSVMTALREFVKRAGERGAVIRLKADNGEALIDHAEMPSVIERVDVVEVDERTVDILGTFEGVLAGSRTFEHTPADGETFKGRLCAELSPEFAHPWWKQRCVARVAISTATRPGGRSRRSYTLLSLSSP